ncbi:fermentation-respiration switch protein FrsA (DUF1100 family) [Methylohalomonas lacus]|uniref:Fermentation-respiration switch protein FrsA (DUF1100 family) n=1 Tax=Methylohalomonas lacus TaxID=398773 RepID=A0AAE3L174_9GAMM|nr:alpha/beta hydrolase [Methylohalomonas lacus]MCS3902771.1 fermentation-respiration switch protein FrsA (DUF1100 family) [Methylohalomonas lacus]
MPLLSRVKHALVSLCVILALTWLGFCLILYLFQERLIFQPTSMLAATPESIGIDYETVELRISDEVVLHGWFIPAHNSRGTVLYLHGNAGNISHRLVMLEMLNHLGLSTLIIDYRGYGNSSGQPSERGTYADAEAAWNHLTLERDIKPDEIIIYGRSLGGAVAAWLAARVEPAGVILESTFVSMQSLAQSIYPYVPVGLLLRNEYPVRENVTAIRSPLLLIHSPDDEIIPYSHAEKLFEAASGSRELKTISGKHDQGFLDSGDSYRNILNKFSQQVLD